MLVQFGNNWIQNIPRTAKLDEALFPNWTACSPIAYTNSVQSTVLPFVFVNYWENGV